MIAFMLWPICSLLGTLGLTGPLYLLGLSSPRDQFSNSCRSVTKLKVKSEKKKMLRACLCKAQHRKAGVEMKIRVGRGFWTAKYEEERI